ncbi:tagaturonate reductase [Mangrovimonas xylaniphaga]|uniref:tagaturonate reductase n=1 Tax=Mangrovimonas xylaniphaga TaxID=1645915 RepID=UPI0006B584B5|nr:tagaturonate reductase [Mangrovimonas xylaniphaga]
MKTLNRENLSINEQLPIKVVQFGEGNFLRAFVDYAIQELNKKAGFNGGVAVVQPIEHGMVNMLNDQDGLYTLFMNGIKKGEEIRDKELVTSIVKGINPYIDFDQYLALAKEESLEFVISNTTEAGIAYDANDTLDMQPQKSFPGKLTALLYHRFQYFNGDAAKGLTIIPCELINYNSDTLKDIILRYVEEWELGDAFKQWVEEHNSFHNTLVDRIVPGYPKDEIESYNAMLDYSDNLIVTAETFFLWVIEGGDDLKKKLPFEKTGLDVKIVDNMQPYRTRKVRILNGAHTALVPLSILYGNETVKQSVDDAFTGAFLNAAVFEEIIPTLDMDKVELETFADEVFDRFRNPFIKHLLSSIALNSVSKFKVRVLPSLLEYVAEKQTLPKHLTYAMACLIQFYKGQWKDMTLPVNDSEEVVAEFNRIWALPNLDEVAKETLGNVEFWGEDLNKVEGLTAAITLALQEIETKGIEQGLKEFKDKI